MYGLKRAHISTGIGTLFQRGKDIGNLAIRKDPNCANREKASNEVKRSLGVAL